MMITKVIAFDHYRQKVILITNIGVDDLVRSYQNGVAQLDQMERMILDPVGVDAQDASVCGEFVPLFTEETFCDAVETVKHHIVEGDIFQAVLSNRFKAPFKGNLMNTYRILRTTNPSPYMVYMKLDDVEIACSSPETLVSLEDGLISSFPLAGTCPRGADPAEDAALIEALLSSEKELAEHDMLVDLARNDVGKVSEPGSVQVREYRQVRRFSHVSHIGSHVTGQLRMADDNVAEADDNPAQTESAMLGAIDVLAAAFPAGTLSGAPKKRACEIIDAAEAVKRGPYGGAMGYIDFAGNMDMCIGIRMAVLKDGHVIVQSGAGVVADSVPELEYQETRNKARAVMDALKASEHVPNRGPEQ